MPIFSRFGADFFSRFTPSFHGPQGTQTAKKKKIVVDGLFRGQFFTVHPSRADRKVLNSYNLKIILTTPTPPISSKKYDPKICRRMRGSYPVKDTLERKGLSQRMWCTNRLLWHTNSDFYGIRTPPVMPYEPFLLGVGVVFNLLTIASQGFPAAEFATPMVRPSLICQESPQQMRFRLQRFKIARNISTESY